MSNPRPYVLTVTQRGSTRSEVKKIASEHGLTETGKRQDIGT